MTRKKLQELIQQLSQEELLDIVLTAAEEDKSLAQRLVLKYGKSTPTQLIAQYKRLIRATEKKFKAREGFIYLCDADRFVDEILELLEDASPRFEGKQKLDLYELFLEEGLEALQYADDSNGSIGALNEEILGKIYSDVTRIVDEETEAQRLEVFKKLLKMSGSIVLGGWEDYELALLKMCMLFADIEEASTKLIKELTSRAELASKVKFSNYKVESLIELKYELLQAQGKKAEAKQLIDEYIHLPFFREKKIVNCMRKRDYPAVISLAEEGEKQDDDYYGLLLKWKAYRYQAYKQLSHKQDQIKLGMELLLDGKYEYYKDLEQLYEGTRDAFYGMIINELKQLGSGRSQELYLRLAKERQDWAEILAYVQVYPYQIVDYAPSLYPHYPEEISRIYEQVLWNQITRASKRTEYRKICREIKQFQAIVGSEQATALISNIKSKYSARKALLDELSKL